MKNTIRHILIQGIEIIRRESGAINVIEKPAYAGKTEIDYYTNADDAVQRFYC
ncbi:MAG: hypothetical protein RLY57_253, partial [Candidatus Parcubacteria bacterium]